MLLEVVAIFTASVAVLCSYILWSHGYWKRRSVPYLPTKFPFGNFANPVTRKEAFPLIVKKFHDEIRSRKLKFGGIVSLASSTLIVVDPEIIRLILSKDFQHFMNRGFYTNEEDDPLSAHMFGLEGQKWRSLRTKLTPTFTSGKLKMMFETIVDCAKPLRRAVGEATEAMNFKDVFAYYTVDVIGSCAFGVDCNSFEDEDRRFLKYGTMAFRRSRKEVLASVFISNFPNAAKKLHIKSTNEEVERFFMGMVKDTVRMRLNGDVSRKDFMQLMVAMLKDEKKNPDGITVEQLCAQGFLFFLAGFETSSSAASYCLYELAKNKEIQEKVREEIQTVLKKHNGEITYDGIQEMKYLAQVVDETLRMYPPLPFLNRNCTTEYRIPETDVVLEKGTKVMISVLGLHKDEEFFPNPDEFDPERFSDESKRNVIPFSYLPFGEGPRNCIGLRFGLLQVKVGLVTLLRDLSFSLNERTPEKLQLEPKAFLMTSLGGIWLDVQEI